MAVPRAAWAAESVGGGGAAARGPAAAGAGPGTAHGDRRGRRVRSPAGGAADAGAEEPRQRLRPSRRRARVAAGERAAVTPTARPAARARGVDRERARAAARAPASRPRADAVGTIRGKVAVPSGEPVAYVYVENVLAPAVKGQHKVIEQAGKKFVPNWAVVQRGTAIAFPNNDNIYHNVFSLSAGQLVRSRPLQLGRRGEVAHLHRAGAGRRLLQHPPADGGQRPGRPQQALREGEGRRLVRDPGRPVGAPQGRRLGARIAAGGRLGRGRGRRHRRREPAAGVEGARAQEQVRPGLRVSTSDARASRQPTHIRRSGAGGAAMAASACASAPAAEKTIEPTGGRGHGVRAVAQPDGAGQAGREALRCTSATVVGVPRRTF